MLATLGNPASLAGSGSCFLHYILTHCAAFTGEQIRLENRSLRLSTTLERLPPLIEIPGDRDVFIWAFTELLANAVRFTPDGGQILLEARAENGEAFVSITDTGIGIPADSGRYLFEPYFGLEDKDLHTSGKYGFKSGGLGLGLTLVKMVMDRHNACITVTSAGENRGTRAEARLKALDVDPS